MKKLPVQFRCYTEYNHDSGHWVAACIDLCIAAQAETEEAAKKSLHAQVQDYFDDACQAPTLSRAIEMLSRKAPYSEIMKYHYIKLRAKLGLNHGRSPSRYKEVAMPNHCVAA